MNSPAAPTFPIADKIRQSPCTDFSPTEEMHVVGHNNVATYCPAMTPMSCTPFFHEDLDWLLPGKNRFAIMDARRDEINREIDPNALKPSQMFMHDIVVAAGVDGGQFKVLPRTGGRGQRPRLQCRAKARVLLAIPNT
jgi:hypothetical protein